MTEHINQIVTLSDDSHIYLQSLYNNVNDAGQPVAGNSYYVGYSCLGADDPTPPPGQQPGQVYQTEDIASLERAPLLLGTPL